MAAKWPTSVATDADLFVAKNALATTLASTITNSDTTISLTNTTNFPVAGAVTIDQEVIFYTNISGSDLTGCVRGSDGTSIAGHNAGVPVSATIIAFHHNGLMAEIEAIETYLWSNAVANPLLGNLAAAGYKITGLGAGSTAGDSLRYEQVIGQFLLLSGGTLTGVILLADGSAAAPSFSFASETGANTGIYWIGQNHLGIATQGTLKFDIDTTTITAALPLAMSANKITGLAAGATNGDALRYEQVIGVFLSLGGGTLTGALLLPDGTVTTPSLTFSNDTNLNTGFYRIAENQIGITAQGVNIGSLTSTGCAFKGTTTNDAPTAGFIGESIISSISSGAIALDSTGVWKDFTSISLTAGDWDVSANILLAINDLVNTTAVAGAISIYSGNTTTDHVTGTNAITTPSSAPGVAISPYRVSLASTTTVYAKGRGTWASGTAPDMSRCHMFARRIR